MVPPWMLLIVSDPFHFGGLHFGFLVFISSPRRGSGLGTKNFLPNDHVKNVLSEFIYVATFTCTLSLHKCGMATVNRGH
jgi:hypothetical protein